MRLGPGSLSVPSHALDTSIFFANNVRVNYPHRYQSDEGGSQRRPAVELAEEADPYLARVGKLSLHRDLSRGPVLERRRHSPSPRHVGCHLHMMNISSPVPRVLGRYERVESFQIITGNINEETKVMINLIF